MQDKVYIILLNYNSWKDSIECIESLYKLEYSNFEIVLVDNASPNDSIEMIEEWAKGNYHLEIDENNPLYEFSKATIPKPMEYTIMEEGEFHRTIDSKLSIIKAKSNNGFSSGNNIGLNYALQSSDAGYFWILNNDTVVEKDSLSNLLSTYKEKESQSLGILGAKVRYYHRPDTLQCAGGAYYNKYLAYSKQIGNQEKDEGQYDNRKLIPDLIIGACMFVNRSFIEKVGLLSEDYFLYYEEQDWAERAKRKGLHLAYEPSVVIYHKEGQSIGATQLNLKGISRLSDFYYARNKIIFTSKFHGYLCLITVYLSFLLIFANRIRRGQINRIPMLFNILLNPGKKFENT